MCECGWAGAGEGRGHALGRGDAVLAPADPRPPPSPELLPRDTKRFHERSVDWSRMRDPCIKVYFFFNLLKTEAKKGEHKTSEGTEREPLCTPEHPLPVLFGRYAGGSPESAELPQSPTSHESAIRVWL